MTNAAAKIRQDPGFITILLIIVLQLITNSVNAAVIKAGVMETTPISIVAEWPISSDTQVGEHFSARVIEDLVSSAGEIIIPRNSRVIGLIKDVQNAKTFHRDAKVDIEFEKIVFPDNVQTLFIKADGTLIKDEMKNIKLAGNAIKATTMGAAWGALTGLKFGGVLGLGTSYGSNLAIGAMTGSSIALISFISKSGKDVEIYPGLPMVLNIITLQEQNYKGQHLVKNIDTGVDIKILSYHNDEVMLEITNYTKRAISLSNLKIVDALGYAVHPDLIYDRLNSPYIAPYTAARFKFKFATRKQDTREWIVITDNFNKQEYCRVEI